MGSPAEDGRPSRRGTAALAILLGLVVLTCTALGLWQVQRRTWKLDLIERVETRATAAPVAVPGPDDPASIPGLEYRRVTATGVFDHGRETLVQAVTELGAGFWVLTPLVSGAGSTVLINRGFVPADRRAAATRPEGNPVGPVTVTGLARLTEPGGAFLRTNDPIAGRWYSRDVAAIAAAHGLGPTGPYFIDADATPNPGGLPVGGLTVLRFRNHHLVYALTWFALALMAAGGIVHLLRSGAAEGTEPKRRTDEAGR